MEAKRIIRTKRRSKKRTVQTKTIFIVFSCLIILGGYTGYLISGLPSLEQLENPKQELATKVYSSDGEVIDQFFIKNRTSVTLKQLPEELVKALIAT